MPVLVRALRTAVRIPGAAAPYDTAHLTVRHPALPPTTDVERMSGRLPVDESGAPYPVVVLVPGVNVAAESYRWLALRLVEAGNVVVGYDWVGELFPGEHGLTPGVDIVAAGPDHYGSDPPPRRCARSSTRSPRSTSPGLSRGCSTSTGSPSSATPPAAPSRCSRRDPSGSPRCARSSPTAPTRWPRRCWATAPTRCCPRPVQAAVLMVAGTDDGVVAASAIRYGEQAGATGHDPVERTWLEALPATTEAWLVHLAGAGHMLAVHPDDPSTARGFLETPTEADQDRLREVLADLVATFLARTAARRRRGQEPSR